MSWLTPLGFLGLIGLIVLIIIYIIKPNYQNKIISSTFIWRLSLKIKKKKIPISKLRNILLFICQMLIITAVSFLLAQPFLTTEKEPEKTQKIAIIDASASMITESDGYTRFERAVKEVRALCDEILENDGRISVILAGEEAKYLIREADASSADMIYAALDSLTGKYAGEGGCAYTEPDLAGAMKLAEQITSVNSEVELLLYTDTFYLDAGNVTVKNMVADSEWNAAILDVRSAIVENYYRFEVDIACFGGVDKDVDVFFDIYGVNAEDGEDGENISLQSVARCMGDRVVTLTFARQDPENLDESINEEIEVRTFDYVGVRIEEQDSLGEDNSFYLYGGTKQPLRVQYCSSLPNNFFGTAMLILRDSMSNRWDIEYKEVRYDQVPESAGFDVYIFEHTVPETLPDDGVVILVNPSSVPSHMGVTLQGGTASGAMAALAPGADAAGHPIMKGMTPADIVVTQYTPIANYDGYSSLMELNGTPVLLARNEPDSKVVVMTFSLNYSNLPILLDFPLLISNIFGYYVPSTITEYVFETGASITMNSRSEELTVVGPGTEVSITQFPGTVKLDSPGVYTISQLPISGKEVTESFYVRMPASESNIEPVEESLENPYFVVTDEVQDIDLLLYFALAMVALLFAEWWLQSRDQF